MTPNSYPLLIAPASTVMLCLAPNLAVLAVGRFLQGASGMSTLYMLAVTDDL